MPHEKSFLTLRDYSPDQIRSLLEEAKDFKVNRASYLPNAPLAGKSLVMIFQKRSTRTRVTTELAMTDLGGTRLFLGSEDIHLGVNETIRDTATVLGRVASGIMLRVFKHADLEEFDKYAGVPIINALSEKYHPLQGLADLMTIEAYLGELRGKVTWVGDGNNVCHSLMIGCAKMGLDMSVASPVGYEPHDEIYDYCKKIGSGEILVTNKPGDAVSGANVVVTDTFISMGQETQKEEKLNKFKEFRVTPKLVEKAAPEFIFMHCLPRHQEEVADEVFYGPHSVVFEEAENRLYTVAAVLLYCLR